MNHLPLQLMSGGAREHLTDMFKRHSLQIDLYILSGLILAITFVKEIPVNIRGQAGTFLGRLFLFFFTIVFADSYSWVNGLLMATLSLLLLSLGPRTVAEGFQSPYDVNLKLVTQKKKWWIEEILHENPIGIQEDSVKTSAIQDNSNASRSSSGQGGSR